MEAVLRKLGIEAVNPGGFCGDWLGGGELAGFDLSY